MKRRLFSATRGLLTVLTVILGCRPHDVAVGSHRLGAMTPTEFSQEERTRRLAVAVDLADATAVTAAIEAGGDVNAYGRGGFSLLVWAMARGNVRGYELLIAHEASLDADARHVTNTTSTAQRQSVLSLVMSNADTRFLKAALRQGLDPNRTLGTALNGSLLFLAVTLRAHPAIEILLDAGADINRQDSSGYTPLVRAMMSCDYVTARLLLARGADPTIEDRQGYDVVWELKTYGSRGVRPDQRESYDAIVTELVARGLLSREDIAKADRPMQTDTGGPPGVTVIEHAPHSEAGRGMRQLDEAEREATRRSRHERAIP